MHDVRLVWVLFKRTTVEEWVGRGGGDEHHLNDSRLQGSFDYLRQIGLEGRIEEIDTAVNEARRVSQGVERRRARGMRR